MVINKVHKLSRWGLVLLCAGSFSLVYLSVGNLERKRIKTLRDLPHTCSCTWCFIQKNKKLETKWTLLVQELGSLTLFELKYI
jgi:hypothetical protein